MSYEAQLISANEEIATKQAAIGELLKGATELTGTKATERAEDLRKLDKELNDLGEKRDEISRMADIEKRSRDATKAAQYNVHRQVAPDTDGPGDEPAAIKSLGDLLRENERYQSAIKSGAKFRGALGEISWAAVKTLSTTADMIGQAQRLPLVPSAQETRTVSDLVLPGTTGASKIEYYEETTFTNAAAETAEGVGKPEAALDFTLREDSVRKIPVWVPITDEMMADNEGFESYLRGRLGFMVEQRLERQILIGDGTAPNISGITDRSSIQTQAKGADPTFDAVFKAITKVRNTGFAEPTALVIHPNDWQDLVLTRNANGNYILGDPGDNPANRLWGLEVRVTSQMTENTALVGAFRPDAQLFRRGGLELAVSDSHSTYFVEDKLAVRAEIRVALAVYRPASFCTVTGI